MRDAGPTCGPETCNGTDDDCDGLIDEGVMTVGPAVVATTSAPLIPRFLVETANGFGVIYMTETDYAVWARTDRDGAAVAGGQPPGLGANYVADAASVGNLTWALAISDFTGPSAALHLLRFDNTTAAPALDDTHTFELPGRLPIAARFASLSATRASAYVVDGDPSFAGPARIRRSRLDLARNPIWGLAASDVASDVDPQATFAVVATDRAEYVVYRRMDGRLALMAGPADDSSTAFHMLGLIGDASSPEADYISLAVRDTSAPVSDTNPLGVAWLGRNQGESRRQTLAFAQVTDTTVLRVSMPTTFSDAYGGWGGFFTDRAVQLVALQDGAGHWLLVSEDTASASPPMGGVLQVRELIGGSTNIRTLTVPGEVLGPQGNIMVTRSGATLRVLESNTDAGAVTRAIGCE
ncbi:MAG: hypothetical protein U0234_19245 [Sandaracinus sp.]